MDIFTSFANDIEFTRKEAEKNNDLDKNILDKICDKAIKDLEEQRVYFNGLKSDVKKVDALSMRGIHESCIQIINKLQDDLGFIGDKRLFNLKSPYNEEEPENDDFDR